VADPQALRELAEALIKASRSPNSFERVQLHTSDGHEYTAMITAGVNETEWQNIPPAYTKCIMPKISILEDYKIIKQELDSTRKESA
jgi:hypothetical protein